MNEAGVLYASANAPTAMTPEPGVIRQVLAYNSHLMLVRHQFEKGWAGTRHSHPHHQLVYVIKGHIRFEAENKSWEMRSGDSIVVNGDIEHRAAALESSEVLDVFTPYREDYAR